jgi:RHS repeat-associated protein
LTPFFRGFKRHPYRNSFILLILVVLAWELSPGPMLDFSAQNPMHKEVLYGAIKNLLTATYGNATIPLSDLTKEIFDNFQQAKKEGKLWGPRVAHAENTNPEVLYYHQDQLGSTRLITLSNGSVHQYINYLPFGKVLDGVMSLALILPGFAFSKRRFTGQEEDKSSGLMFYQSRFYDPEIARFIQPDDQVGGNRYTYVGNNPLRFVDPTGHSWLSVVGDNFMASMNEVGGRIAMAYACAVFGGPVGMVIGLLVLFGAVIAMAGAILNTTYSLMAVAGTALLIAYMYIYAYIGPMIDAYIYAKEAQYESGGGTTQGTEKPAESIPAQSGAVEAKTAPASNPVEANQNKDAIPDIGKAEEFLKKAYDKIMHSDINIFGSNAKKGNEARLDRVAVNQIRTKLANQSWEKIKNNIVWADLSKDPASSKDNEVLGYYTGFKGHDIGWGSKEAHMDVINRFGEGKIVLDSSKISRGTQGKQELNDTFTHELMHAADMHHYTGGTFPASAPDGQWQFIDDFNARADRIGNITSR